MDNPQPEGRPPRRRGRLHYFDGQKWRYGDSLRTQRNLYIALGANGDREEVAAVLTASASPDPSVSGPATEKLMAAVREAFEMAPFDAATGAGATEEDTRAALAALWETIPNGDDKPGIAGDTRPGGEDRPSSP